MPYEETPEAREARQRLSAMLTLEGITEGGFHFRPMMEVVREDGPAILIGWPGGADTPNARALQLGVALAVAAPYNPLQVCVIYDARFVRVQEDYDPDDLVPFDENPAAQDCLIVIRSTREEQATLEILPYGRDDTGRLEWSEPSSVAPMGDDPAARILADFWDEEGSVLRLPPGDPEARLVAARMFVPGLTILNAAGEDEPDDGC